MLERNIFVFITLLYSPIVLRSEVISMSPAEGVVRIPQRKDRPWSIGDKVCVFQEGKGEICGEIILTTPDEVGLKVLPVARKIKNKNTKTVEKPSSPFTQQAFRSLVNVKVAPSAQLGSKDVNEVPAVQAAPVLSLRPESTTKDTRPAQTIPPEEKSTDLDIVEAGLSAVEAIHSKNNSDRKPTSMVVSDQENILKDATEKEFHLVPHLSVSRHSYKETDVPNYDLTSLDLGFEGDISLSENAWHVALGSNITLFSLSASDPSTSVKFLGFQLAPGFRWNWGKVELDLAAGYAYRTMLVSPTHFGYSSVNQVLLNPSVFYPLNRQSGVKVMLHLGHVLGTSNGLSPSSRELSTELQYQQVLSSGTALMAGALYGEIGFPVEASTISSSQISFRVGLGF